MDDRVAALDADELLHLALRAMQANQHEHSLSCLKRAIALTPDDGRLHYLLGAVYAQLGMRPRAIEETTRAIERSPTLADAHFQLGLLHLAGGDADLANAAWLPLDRLDPEAPINLFRIGLQQVTRGELRAGAATLRRGIEVNTGSEALNRSMMRTIAEVEAALESDSESASKGPDPRAVGVASASTDTPHHFLLKAYSGNQNGES